MALRDELAIELARLEHWPSKPLKADYAALGVDKKLPWLEKKLSDTRAATVAKIKEVLCENCRKKL